mgnify:FL=1
MAVMAMCVLLSCTEKKEEATLSGLMKSDFVSEVQGETDCIICVEEPEWCGGLCDKRGAGAWYRLWFLTRMAK